MMVMVLVVLVVMMIRLTGACWAQRGLQAPLCLQAQRGPQAPLVVVMMVMVDGDG